MNPAKGTITAAAQAVEAVTLKYNGRVQPVKACVSVSGVFVATLTIQRSLDSGVTWDDLANYTAPFSADVQGVDGVLVRVFCKAGNFTSGTVNYVVRA